MSLHRLLLSLGIFCISWAAGVGTAQAESWTLHERLRLPAEGEQGSFTAVERSVDWDPRRTAVVVCDMWDQHWCQGATARVAELAPRVKEALRAARARGMLVIHCPSDTMKFYADTPQRKLAQSAPRVALKSMPAGWCALASGTEPALPFDNLRDRCDCQPQCAHGNPWRRQIATIDIAPEDAIADGDDAYFLMRERGIDNVVLLGVHTNMCVLGRPFSIRKLCAQGQNVVLVRDLTDSMHDSQSPPAGLDHFRATDLIIEHIEKYWCPTITSRDLLGGLAFHFQADTRPHVVLLIGEDEYETAKSLPAYAERDLTPRGLRTTIIHENPADKNDFPGIEAINTADVLLVSVRRRTLSQEQLDIVRRYVASGKPVVGIRTASHAFSLRGDTKVPAGHASWPEFDAEVLGGHYVGHHPEDKAGGQQTTVWALPAAKGHVILADIPTEKFGSHGTLYKTSPLAETATPLLMGKAAEGRDEPVAWTNRSNGGGRVFYTSLGHIDDFQVPAFRSLLARGIFWALDKPFPDTMEQPK